ncbi:MAG: hypothetical protein CVV57_10940 [Tenericutes bacterium HGW-Tenericutes-2]|jgi:nitrite reductase/ring-hydroxylating ferredoxin subunit|nr:MAG: hypothetical protein CVV57_10940 [Tenericutes bacterium HGW-Tenericutes-2]PKL01344.1 MAG: hypothetical protein CVV56_01725 [Tenericutes bacterium HGW-Tenericutes-1]
MLQYACDLSTLQSKNKVRLMINNRPVLLVISDGLPFAIADKCPHQGYSLFTGKYDNGIIACKEHGLQIDVRTGKIVNPLKAAALRMDESEHTIKTYELFVENDKVYFVL